MLLTKVKVLPRSIATESFSRYISYQQRCNNLKKEHHFVSSGISEFVLSRQQQEEEQQPYPDDQGSNSSNPT
jgi:hypothetical protein